MKRKPESFQIYGGSPWCNPIDHPMEKKHYCEKCRVLLEDSENGICDKCEAE